MLFLTDDYIGDFSEDEFSESPDLSTKSSESLDSNLDHKLSQSQRREVFDRLLILFGIAGILLFALMPIAAYYRVWILQRINQALQ